MVAAARTVARALLGLFLVAAGIGHFVAPEAFLAQTPTWLPARPTIVAVSGAIEIALGIGLLTVRRRRRELGWAVAAFFVAIFPGNVHQAISGTAAFGLDTAAARWTRLAFQPLLVLWALWATGALGRPEARQPTGGGRTADDERPADEVGREPHRDPPGS
jgi:uncharacterized membrane protein